MILSMMSVTIYDTVQIAAVKAAGDWVSSNVFLDPCREMNHLSSTGLLKACLPKLCLVHSLYALTHWNRVP